MYDAPASLAVPQVLRDVVCRCGRALILGAAVEASFGYRDQRRQISAVLEADARAASDRIEAFTDGIRDQLGWMVQLPWSAGDDAQHKTDALRLLQQVPAIVSVSLLDETGTERVFVSRLLLNRTGRGIDMSADPAVRGARANKVRTDRFSTSAIQSPT